MSEFRVEQIHGELVVHYSRNVSKEPGGRLMVPDAIVLRHELKVADRLLSIVDLLQGTFPDLLVEKEAKP